MFVKSESHIFVFNPFRSTSAPNCFHESRSSLVEHRQIDGIQFAWFDFDAAVVQSDLEGMNAETPPLGFPLRIQGRRRIVTRLQRETGAGRRAHFGHFQLSICTQRDSRLAEMKPLISIERIDRRHGNPREDVQVAVEGDVFAVRQKNPDRGQNDRPGRGQVDAERRPAAAIQTGVV